METPLLTERPTRYRSVLIAVAPALFLAGCAIPAGEVAPVISPIPTVSDVSAAYHAGLIASHPAFSADALPTDWISVFGDPVLTALVAQAQADGLDMQIAASRVAQNAAVLGAVISHTAPQVGLGGSQARSAISANSPLAAMGAYTGAFNLWDVGVQLGWEIDLWKHAEHRSDAAHARWQASQFQLGAAQVSLSAEVARNYLLLRETQQQTRLQTGQLELASRRVQLMVSRLRHGTATAADVASARADEAAAQAILPRLNEQAQMLGNGLARLLGLPPHALDVQLQEAAALPPPDSLPIGIPSELALRRPDVLLADAQLRAAVADTAAARSDFYPRITLGANLGLEALRLKDLGSWDSHQFGIGPAFHLPLFDGGRLRQTLALTEARQREAALQFRGAVLKAWQEVEDALQQQVNGRSQWLLWQASEQHRLQAMDVVTKARAAGAADELAMIDARRAWLAAASARQTSATQVKLSAVALARALGGGWVQPAPSAEARL